MGPVLSAIARATIAALGVVSAASPASAVLMQATYTGTLEYGFDQTGLFGKGVNSSLASLPYVLTFIYDTDTPGIATQTSATSNQIFGGEWAGGAPGTPSPMRLAKITINGHSETTIGSFYGEVTHFDGFGKSGAGSVAWEFSNNSTSYKNILLVGGLNAPAHTVPLNHETPFAVGNNLVNDIGTGLTIKQGHYVSDDLVLKKSVEGEMRPESISVVKVSSYPLESSQTYSKTSPNLFFVEPFSPDKPTIVLTHGWQPQELIPSGSEIFDGLVHSFIPYKDPTIDDMAFGSELRKRLASELGTSVNILVYNWPEAFAALPGANYLSHGGVAAVGSKLGNELLPLLGGSYDQPIQFIGHSYGTAVNAYAIDTLLAHGISVTQETMLDAPIKSTAGNVLGLTIPTVDYTRHVGKVERLENFFGEDGYGGPITGAINTLYLDANHSEVWSEYSATIVDPTQSKGGFYYSVALGESGGYLPFTPDVIPAPPVVWGIPDFVAPALSQNASFDTANSTVMTQGSDAYLIYQFVIPEFASTLTFNLEFFEIGTNDWFEVLWNDLNIFSILASEFPDGERSMFIDISRFAGQDGILAFLLSDHGLDRSSLRLSNVAFLSSQNVDASPVPIPAALPLFVAGLGAVGFMGWRNTRNRSRQKSIVL